MIHRMSSSRLSSFSGVDRTSTNGLELTDDQIIEKREKLKFDLLKHSIIGESFRNISEKRKTEQKS